MPAYKTLDEKGRVKSWFSSCYYKDWKGERHRKVKRGFPTRAAALEWERDFIDKVFKDADKDIRNFMKLVIDKGRSYYMQEIFESYEKRANEELGIQKAVVTSARKLSEEDMQRIKETLAKKTGKTIVLTNKVDPSVIAGIKVTVGNNVTDITMSTRIEQLRNALLKGGQA